MQIVFDNRNDAENQEYRQTRMGLESVHSLDVFWLSRLEMSSFWITSSDEHLDNAIYNVLMEFLYFLR